MKKLLIVGCACAVSFGLALAPGLAATKTPHGFSQGQKAGWSTGHTPPGWSQGNKVGWQGKKTPPGLRR
jgi:hypothetical protein